MKKVILTCLAVLFGLSSFAQSENTPFSHLSIGVSTGTTGLGVDLATPLSNVFQVRAGVSILPLTVKTDLDTNGFYSGNVASEFGSVNIPNEVDIKGSLKMTGGKLLLDIFPSQRSSFHFTAGALISGKEIVTIENEKDGALKAINEANANIAKYNQAHSANEKEIGLALGDYLLTPDKNGNMKGSISTVAVKPYVGLGFGRAVPKKSVGFMFELGALIWGKPTLSCNGTELKSENLGGDEGDLLKSISKLSVYPVMNFRVCFKAF